MSTISFSRIQAALRAMGIDKHEEVTSVVWEPHAVTVTRHELRDGKPYLDNSGDIATSTTVFAVDYAKDDADDGTGLTYADVVLVHDDSVVFNFHVVEEAVYLADVGIDGTIDIHLYGKGSASKSSSASSVSEPMPAESEATACSACDKNRETVMPASAQGGDYVVVACPACRPDEAAKHDWFGK